MFSLTTINEWSETVRAQQRTTEETEADGSQDTKTFLTFHDQCGKI